MAAAKISGIYEIVNLANGKRYVGSSILVRKRWACHRRELRSGKHHSRHLQNAWLKHGEDSFSFRMLEAVPEKEMLIKREQHYIDALRPEYNCSPTAGSCLGHKWTADQRSRLSDSLRKNPSFKGKKHSAGTIEVLSRIAKARFSSEEGRIALVKSITTPDVVAKKSACMVGNKIWLGRSHTAETKRKLSDRFKGRSFNEHTRRKMSESQKARPPITDDTRKKMSRSSAGLANPSAIREKIAVENERGDTIRGTPFEIRTQTGISAPRMTALMNGNAKSSKGWRIVAR